MLNLSQYQGDEQIYESNNSLVYRGVRLSDGQPVVLKLLQGEYPTPQQLTNYRQEYEITRSLKVAGVVQVYELLTYHHSLVMVLEDFGGQSLKQLSLAGTLSLEAFLALAIQMSDIVGQVHQAQIIHKDINPANWVFNTHTQTVKLIDFGISTRLSREYTTFCLPNHLEGTLAYISPEQTGRMNRALDYRTDLYSLGVTLYELWTGQLPFKETDPMALIHAHIARQPIAPVEQLRMKNEELRMDKPSLLPTPYALISDIIMKLLAKNAEDRYQSAFGLKYDLETMKSDELRVMSEKQSPDNSSLITHHSSFSLGQRDFSGRFQIPQKLYGRAQEIQLLLESCERVASGEVASELLLVTGYSGVGKSALVYEIHKPLTKSKGYFISGKYDPFQRNIPYYGLTQALNEFCQLLLTETEAQLQQWKKQLLAAVGKNGQLLIEVIPALELVIGAQPPVAEAGARESQNRFNLVFQKFMQVICQADHPLVLFIDDLQWADLASLELLKELLLNSRYLLLIGAYRVNEVTATHPLTLMLETLTKTEQPLKTLSLPNLTPEEVMQLVAETLQTAPAAVTELAALLYTKTQGNAFFVTQFLTTLYEEGMLRFDYATHGWQWDVAQIQGLQWSNNVVDLMTSKLTRLEEDTQTMLKWAACIGNQFTLARLATVTQQSLTETLTLLWIALEEGLLVPLDENYRQIMALGEDAATLDSHFKFLHDRVQQAAYALIAEADRPAFHLKLGRLWLAHAPELEEQLFEIVNQLNQGQALLVDVAEQLELAQLNLMAAKRAKKALAYPSALQYLTAGLTIYPEQVAEDKHALTFELYKERCELEYLNGHYNESEAWGERALSQARTNVEQAEIYCLLVMQRTVVAQFEAAAQAGLAALQLLGVELPQSDLDVAMAAAEAETQQYLAERTLPSLLEAPEMSDPEKKMAVKIMIHLGPPLVMTHINLWNILVVRRVNLLLKYGHVAEAATGYLSYGNFLAGGRGNYELAYQFGLLGLQLSERFPHLGFKAQAHYMFANFINAWNRHFKEANAIYEIAFLSGVEAGDIVAAGYAMAFSGFNFFYQGLPLSELQTKLQNFATFLRRSKHRVALDLVQGLQLVVTNLMGATTTPSLDTPELAEAAYLNPAAPPSEVVLCYYYTVKAEALYLQHYWAEAQTAMAEAHKRLPTVLGGIGRGMCNFYYSLVLMAGQPALDSAEWQQVQANQTQLWLWAEYCPDNYEHQYLLVEAELARGAGQTWAAIEKYRQSIASAKKYGFIQHEAMGHELCARLWRELGCPDYAAGHVRNAHYLYQQWGAMGKVKQLEAAYPELQLNQPYRPSLNLGTVMTTTSQRTSSTGSQMLDLASVMKASQAISGEIQLDRLLQKMMQIVLENAGAQRGVLMLRQGNQCLLQAEAMISPSGGGESGLTLEVLQAISLDMINGQSDNPKVSATILRYVERSQKALVLNDARREGQFTQTPYIRKLQPKSILCVPLVNQGVVLGLIYLENNLSTHAFTPERVEIVQLLGTQATISLHNVQAIALQAEQERLRIENEMLGKLNTDKDKFFSIVAHDLRGPFMPLLGFSELLVQMADSFSVQEIKTIGTQINRSARNTFNLLESLLTWARLQMGRMEYQPEPLDVAEVAAKTVELLSDNAKAKQIKLYSEVLPQSWVYGDANMLDTIIRNLTNNALKFTNEGGKVTISTRPAGKFMEVSVADTGVGMSETTRQKLFRLDQHVTTVGTGKETGTGLGLIICHEMVVTGGGQIWVESELDVGTTFKFTMPAIEPLPQEKQATVAEMESISPIETQRYAVPSTERLKELQTLALSGDWYKVETWLQEERPMYQPFCEQVFALVDIFDWAGVVELVNQYL